ncbi:MAG: hypothetical protein JOZ81_09095 [Chloroflexi bacterium]|nr:hypothetical protein [Chloroflexota bacterium]
MTAIASGFDLLQQALRFFLLVIVATVAGYGMIRLLRVRFSPDMSLVLAAPAMLATWSLALGLGVSAGLPVKQLYVPIWVATLGLAAYGVRAIIACPGRPAWTRLAALLVAPVAVGEAYFRWGLTTFPGSPFLDGWSYVAFGQYLWEYPRYTDGGLAPLYQYAAQLSHERYIGAALLGFVSPVLGNAGDTQVALGALMIFALFVLACACVVFAESYAISAPGALALVGLVVFSGWSVSVISHNALSNSLALYTLPALVGIARVADLRRPAPWLLLAVLLAALLYTYPELAWVAPMAGALILGERVARMRGAARELVKPAAIGILVCAMLVLPFASDLVNFVRGQAYSALEAGGERQGEGLFHGLTTPAALPWSVLGFDDAQIQSTPFSGPWLLVREPLGLLFVLLGAAGFIVLLRRRELSTCAAIVLLLIAASVMAARFNYAYGVFKILVTGWCLLALCILEGARAVLGALARGTVQRRAGLAVAAAACLAYGLGVVAQIRGFEVGVPTRTFDTYRAARQAASVVGSAPILLAVTDDAAAGWAVYELRDAPILMDTYSGYMGQPHVIPFMQRARRPAETEIHYILTDSAPAAKPVGLEPLWSGGAYALWRVTDQDWAVISGIDAPNGIEKWLGSPSFWVGTTSTDLQITSTQATEACLGADLSLGPSLPDLSQRHLQVSTDDGGGGVVQFSGTQAEELSVPLLNGVTRISLIALDKPTQVLAGGDPRTLLVGVQNLRLALGPCPSVASGG